MGGSAFSLLFAAVHFTVSPGLHGLHIGVLPIDAYVSKPLRTAGRFLIFAVRQCAVPNLFIDIQGFSI